MKKDIEYVSVSGYGSTGSSAVVNLLEEVEICEVISGEFRFIQDPDGIEDLCTNIKESWGWVRSDAYIQRFIKFTDLLGRSPGYFEFGKGLDKRFNNNFFKFRDEFLDSIVDCTWQGHWFYHDYHENNFLKIFIEKLKQYSKKLGVSKLTIRKLTKKSNMYFVRHDVDIEKYAKIFINKLFSEVADGKDKIILDQLILPYNRDNFSNLFSKLKQIIVDRDPRDVYLDAMTYNAYPITNDINTFISFYESSHNKEKIVNSGDTLYIKFEDLIYDYEITRSVIFKFLHIDDIKHQKKYSKLRPDISIKNTQQWKRKEFQQYSLEIEEIEKKLKDWCYDFPDSL